MDKSATPLLNHSKIKINSYYLLAPLTVLMGILVLMMFTGLWPWKSNGYNSYTLQAVSWLQGRLDLGQDYEWLELAIYGGKYYVSFPPFPSYILLPFAMIFGTKTPDHWIALTVTMIGVVYAYRLCEKYCESKEAALFWTIFLYLGTGALFVCINGWVWFIAQNMCFTLSLMALWYASEGKGGLSLSFWACAVGCRPMAALYFPVLCWIIWKRVCEEKIHEKKIHEEKLDKGKLSDEKIRGEKKYFISFFRKKWHWAIGPFIIALSYMILNYARFGSVTEFGHNYLPEFTRTTTGQFDLAYLSENLKHLFRLPTMAKEGDALIFPTADGMAFWLATPLFLSIIAAWCIAVFGKKKKDWFLLISLPVLVLVHVFILCCHKTLGGWHFGNRYLLDTLPYLMFGLLCWQPGEKSFARSQLPLCFFGIALNMIGIAATYNYWLG